MPIRRLAAPVSLALLLVSLSGCGAMKFSSSEPAAGDSLATGNAAFDRKDYATACRELAKAGPGAGAELLTRTGIACAKDGREKADRAFTAALSTNGGYAPAMEGLGLTTLAEGNAAKARDLLEAASRAGGKDAQAAVGLGDALLLTGQCDKALAAYQEAQRRDAGLAVARARLEAVRTLCAARGKATPAASSSAAPSRGSGATGSDLQAPSAPAGGPGKEAGKAKPAPRTIDLNDI
ncbi:MAG: tetratricopeptide repeat protein [Solidesulfovibrio sp. DCME]|uniref:tetratricopeptide repeat protein n=1 Tax=Solidesulfovibrio sp. DCME TaxID=3447380 RepID=UPI003D09689D